MAAERVIKMYNNPYMPAMNGYQNPYMMQQTQVPQKYEVVRVSGENGARAFQMAANSSILLLDETQPVVWLKTTDGAGYPTITPYTITPVKQAQAPDMASLEARIAKLEAKLNESNPSETKSGQTGKYNGTDRRN